MCHATHSFWTTDSIVIEGFLSSAPKTSKRTRRPRPKPKTTPTPEAPQTKPGKCGSLVKGLSPCNSWESGVHASSGSDSPCEPHVGKGTKWPAAVSPCWISKGKHDRGDACGSWIPCAFYTRIYSFTMYFIYFFLFHSILLLKKKNVLSRTKHFYFKKQTRSAFHLSTAHQDLWRYRRSWWLVFTSQSVVESNSEPASMWNIKRLNQGSVSVQTKLFFAGVINISELKERKVCEGQE